jgi:hypothetical protein
LGSGVDRTVDRKVRWKKSTASGRSGVKKAGGAPAAVDAVVREGPEAASGRRAGRYRRVERENWLILAHGRGTAEDEKLRRIIT